MGRFYTIILAVSLFVSFPCFLLEAREEPVRASPLRKSKSWFMTTIRTILAISIQRRGISTLQLKRAMRVGLSEVDAIQMPH
jgi:hypothetical protein